MPLRNKTGLKILRVGIAASLATHKREERRWSGDHPLRLALYKERQKSLRPGMRCLNLAYGFLRGRSLRQIENNARKRPDWEQVEKDIQQFSNLDSRSVKQRLAEWISDASLPREVAPGLSRHDKIGRKIMGGAQKIQASVKEAELPPHQYPGILP